MDNFSFRSFSFENGLLYEDDVCTLYALTCGRLFNFSGGTYYVYVQRGYPRIDRTWLVPQGFYGSFTRGYIEAGPGSQVMIVNHRHAVGTFTIAGPIEKVGRLKYIDGCTDSLLVPPIKLGDPCLNHLHFPDSIVQTMHTHPSVRIGLVAKGAGYCVTPFGTIELREGMLFAILPENGTKEVGLDGHEHPVGSHCFLTTNTTMDVIAFHPDSDFGPTDEDHPMINRTIVDGVSAKHIDDIRTK